MRLLQLPGAYIVLILSSSLACGANAQFTYPPPLDRPLSEYTTGEVTSALNFSEGDNMFGGWTTPGRLMSFLLYRCVHTPTSKTIYPSNSTFTSRAGKVAEDGTWEQMPLYEGFDNAFGNGFNPGDNPIWFHGDFFAPNETTGNLCWFELYPGHDEITYGDDGGVREATVNGASDWYFATVPFIVKPRRPTGQTVTWKDDGTERGKPVRNIFDNSTNAKDPSNDTNSDDSDPDSSGSSLKWSAACLASWSLLLCLSLVI
ncbi:hypothetical protein HJFPF1_02231 [Paramyrothecium foliicola]|nr:hypothetical protein HJFPF1_02231 [Paramyrothecium foliicola]